MAIIGSEFECFIVQHCFSEDSKLTSNQPNAFFSPAGLMVLSHCCNLFLSTAVGGVRWEEVCTDIHW